jgi:hypothetical protein
MDSALHARNDAARARLAARLQRLTPQDLDRPIGGGWTVKAALLHLAFWDRFAATVAEQWQRTGYVPPGDDDAYINIAALNDWLAASPDYARREALRAAELADCAADGIGEALRSQIVAGGDIWVFERGIHRVEHIEQIERSLKAGVQRRSTIRNPGSP